jgi:tripartite-type tricarboxylate transporter receptor subunit TctC
MMKLNPAGLLFIILLCWIVGSFSSSAQTGVVTIVVPFTPGTIPDYLSRVLAQQLKDQLGFPVITDNRPGASGNLCTFRVARSKWANFMVFVLQDQRRRTCFASKPKVEPVQSL